MSCLRASGRGEAVWAWERGLFVNAGAQNGDTYSSCHGFGFCVFAALSMEFCSFHTNRCCSFFFRFLCFVLVFLMLRAWFLRRVFADRPPLLAICGVFAL